MTKCATTASGLGKAVFYWAAGVADTLSGYTLKTMVFTTAENGRIKAMISREEAIKTLQAMDDIFIGDCTKEAIDMAIEALSNERPKGRWEFDRHHITHNWLYRCASCDGWNEDTPPFCPNCGADMRDGEGA